MKNIYKVEKASVTVAMTLMLLGAGAGQPATALPLSLNDSPLFLLSAVDPNVILTFDDSGSMAWGYMPDGVSGLGGTRRGCSSTINGMYYNPNVTYAAGVDTSGNPLPNASFTGAWINGYNTGAGTVDLSTSYRPVWSMNSAGTTNNYVSCDTAPLSTAQQAFYYTFDATLAGTGGCPSVADINDDDCYRLVRVSATSGPSSTDERTNFANWYSYYRTRTLAAKSAAGRALSRLPSNMRLAYQRLNTCNSNLGTAPTTGCPGSSVRPFDTTARTTFLNWLYGSPASSGTPLRSAMVRAGQYLSNTTANGPWAQTPGTSVGTEYSCRQNFHIAFTDGLWNSDSPSGYGNADNSSATFPDGTAYSPSSLPANRRIFPDGNSNSLADIAFYFWSEDARTLTNNVPTIPADKTGISATQYFDPSNDPANWQHLVNFTVGMGVTGTLNPANYFDESLPATAGDYDDLLAGTKTWPAIPTTDSPEKVDDLWHAAINSRGRYFSATNPQELVDSFTAVVNAIASRTGSGAALAANAGSVGSSTFLYQAKFNSGTWTGQLLGFPVNATNGTLSNTPAWDGAVELNTQNYDSGRTILTYNPTSRDGVRFRWGNITTTQQADLNKNPAGGTDTNGAARLDYLRGQTSNEGTGLNFRTRVCYDVNGVPLSACPAANTGKMGDVVHSAPLYVGAPPYDYPETLESKSYSSFASSRAGRTPTVYVGANDGMMHAFDANTGREVLAYVPASVYSNLSRLTSPSYTHLYFVDGSPMAGDAFINNDWRTVLIGGLRNGGRGYYALDVTDPTTFGETGAAPANTVLWEFTDTDLGFTHSTPSIVKMANGKWAAIFGNGYNNVSPGNGHAILYIVFIEDGVDGTWSASDFVKIDTGVGSTTTPNGLATPGAVDINRDHVVDFIYAGDQQGNMWRFDVRSSTPNQWTLAGNRNILFAAGANQPITARPVVGKHPNGGRLVYFGTGKYLEAADNITTGAATQTFYAVWDRDLNSTVPPSDLLQQQIQTTTTHSGFDVRIISDNPINWRQGTGGGPGTTHLGWYLDLPTTAEKQVTDPILRDGKIIFTTLIPATSPCQPGGDGWLMELDAINGGRLDDTFDLTDDGLLTDADKPAISGQNIAAAGVKSGKGAPSTPVIIGGPAVPTSPPPPAGGECIEYKFSSTSDGQRIRMPEKCQRARVRESWQQLR